MTYQERYLAHQQRKKKVLQSIIEEHYSTRTFSDQELDPEKLSQFCEEIYRCPNSCDRQAISYMTTSSRDDKALLSGLLVGATGWLHRAPSVVLLFADKSAYVENLPYMPFLDAGVAIGFMYKKAKELGLKCCYVNPQVRKENEAFFQERFVKEGLVYCGAFGVGYEK